MIEFSHPTGNANVRAALNGIEDAGLLTEFYTTIATFPGDFLDKLGELGIGMSELKRRGYNRQLSSYTKTSFIMEAGRLLSSKVGLRSLTRHETGLFCVDAIYRNQDRKVATRLKKMASKGVKGIYGYEDGAEFSFLEAKSLGLQCFYDLPIGYWRAAHDLLENEKERWPEWASTLVGFKNSAAKLERKDNELRLADKIFVASSFTASTLKYFPGNLSSVEVIPYGFPATAIERDYQPTNRGRKLRILFVGGLSQRKGIADLFAAVKNFKNSVELTVVGRKTVSHCAALDQELSRHKWIPSLPHAEILKLMKDNDVLIFPSLFEGFGLVISEAMSQGTPVITTDRTAGPDLITSGKDGWIVPAGSPDSLSSSIENLLIAPDQIQKAGKEALQTARERPWQVYGEELARSIAKQLS